MAISPSLALYRLFGNSVPAQVSQGKTDGIAHQDRPPGRLIWMHCPSGFDHQVAVELVAQIADDFPDCWFLLTTEGEAFDPLPDQGLFQIITDDRPADARDFLDQWAPDLMIWLSDHLLPTLIDEAAKRAVPLILLDSGSAFETTRKFWFLPGLARRTLRKFDTVLSSDEATTLALISAGVRRNSIRTTGALELTVSPPKCSTAEWSLLAEQLATRPVWLAAHIQIDDLKSVLAAHTQATRRAHRLLLIIVPADLKTADEFASLLLEMPFTFSVRSKGEEPEPGIQVYLADTDEELGLWYRLAPVTYIGQTPYASSQIEPNPLETAALGSVVMFSPGASLYEVAYQRLVRAGAARPISHLGELAHALETVLAPDRAAVMAHAAWQITSAGAEALDASRSVIGAVLDDFAGKDL